MLGPNGLLKGKARILCTNSVSFLSQTDSLLMLRGGEMVEQTTYEEVMEKRNSPLFSLINGLGKQVDSSPGTPAELSDGASTAVDEQELDLDQLDEKARVARRRFSQMSLERATLLSDKQSRYNAIKDLQASTKPKEAMSRGQVKGSVYKNYIQAASVWGCVCFLLATFAAQGTSILGNLSVNQSFPP